MRRPALAVTALVASLVLAACGGDDGTDAAADPSATPTPSVSAGPTADASADASQSPSSDPSQQPEDGPQSEVLEVTVQGDGIEPNAAELDLAVGDSLTLEIASDRDGELHVHANPESYVDFVPGVTTETITFTNPGTVEIEEHDTGFTIAIVRVR